MLQGLATISLRQNHTKRRCRRSKAFENLLPNDRPVRRRVLCTWRMQWSTCRCGIQAILAHECTFPVICNVSNKYNKRPRCASSHAPTTIPISMIITTSPQSPALSSSMQLHCCPLQPCSQIVFLAFLRTHDRHGRLENWVVLGIMLLVISVIGCF